jgi:hypothetical protein
MNLPSSSIDRVKNGSTKSRVGGKANSGVDFEEALTRCRETAELEYAVALEAIRQARKIGALLSARLRARMHGGDAENGQSHIPEVLSNLSERIENQSQKIVETAYKTLMVKRSRLKKFTVALFGRTMAGKSTLREAITGGDGTSIGKGGQNTTKRLHEYSWRGIHIIDTPGIGSFKGARFRELALSALRKCDLVLFLLSDDGIHEEVFEGMRDVLLESKPLLFVLNVKRDLEKPVYLKQFLRNPDSVLGLERIEGHFHRLHHLAVDVLGTSEPKIFPIHAQAAQLSSAGHTEANRLYKASRLDDIHEAICEAIRTKGPVRRLQTLLDGTIASIEKMQCFYSAQSSKLLKEAEFFESKADDLAIRAANLIADQEKAAIAQLQDCFQGLRNQVFHFVEDNIENQKIGSLWQNRVKAAKISKRIQEIQESIIEKAKNLILDFERELSVDIHFLGSFSTGGTPRHADVWDLRRGLGRTAAAAGVLSAAALLAAQAGAANFWNPVGWTLLGVSIIAGIAAWFVGKKANRLAKEKENARNQLHDQLNKRERDVRKAIIKWLHHGVKEKSIQPVIDDLTVLAGTMASVGRSLRAAARLTQRLTNRLNARLLLRLAELGGIDQASAAPSPVARCRGLVFRAVCAQSNQDAEFSKLASEILSEDVRVLKKRSPRQMLKDCLAPLRFKRIRQSAAGFEIYLCPEQTEPLGSRQSDFAAVVQRIIPIPLQFHPYKDNE